MYQVGLQYQPKYSMTDYIFSFFVNLFLIEKNIIFLTVTKPLGCIYLLLTLQVISRPTFTLFVLQLLTTIEERKFRNLMTYADV